MLIFNITYFVIYRKLKTSQHGWEQLREFQLSGLVSFISDFSYNKQHSRREIGKHRLMSTKFIFGQVTYIELQKFLVILSG